MMKQVFTSAFGTMLALALAACATPAPVPAVSHASTKPDLSKLPEPAERPEAPASVTDPELPLQTRIDNFVDYTTHTYGVPAQVIRDALAQAEMKQSILDAMSRPAEKVSSWADYRPIFMTDARIDGGRAFYREHRDALERVAAATGVPPEYVVAIIGVETSYGRITGNYRVLDALYTLAFGYPKRAPFFGGELAQLFALAQEENLEIEALKGSYAGAMGFGQFMPSSYRLDGEPTVPAGQGATLIPLDGAQGREYWIGYRNFYVITRYNHSPKYAMAVHQLATAIRAGIEDNTGA